MLKEGLERKGVREGFLEGGRLKISVKYKGEKPFTAARMEFTFDPKEL